MLACLLAAPQVTLSVSASADNGWPHNALRYTVSSCQSVAISAHSCKRCYSKCPDL